MYIKKRKYKRVKPQKELERGTGELLSGTYACELEGCTSSDGMRVYKHLNDDGVESFSTYCFVCQGSIQDYKLHDFENNVSKEGFNMDKMTEVEMAFEAEDEITLTKNPKEFAVSKSELSVKDVESKEAFNCGHRKLKKDMFDFYGVKMDKDTRGISKHYYPVYKESKLVGYKQRGRLDDGKLKNFALPAIGDRKGNIELFGQHLFTPKRFSDNDKVAVYITEGELDAITGYKLSLDISKAKPATGRHFVSLPNGAAQAKQALQANLHWLKQYDEVVLCFDADEAGENARKDACEFLVNHIPVSYMRLPNGYKDLSDLLMSCANPQDYENVKGVFKQALYNPLKYMPSGILDLASDEVRDLYTKRKDHTMIRFPDSFGNLNAQTNGGMALGDIVSVVAASSIGKTLFIKEMIYSVLTTTNYKIGVFSFEETLEQFIEQLLNIHLSKRVAKGDRSKRNLNDEYNEFLKLIKVKVAFDEEGNPKVVGNDGDTRVFFYNEQGSVGGEVILNKVDQLYNTYGCQVIVCDPITLGLQGDNMDIDDLTSQIVKRVLSGNLCWINSHHVRKSGGGNKANSEGGEISEEDIKGSGAWLQTSTLTLTLKRNKVHKDDEIKSTTVLKLAKCRRNGEGTGLAGTAYYNAETGRLQKGMSMEEYEERSRDKDDKKESRTRNMDNAISEKFSGKIDEGMVF